VQGEDRLVLARLAAVRGTPARVPERGRHGDGERRLRVGDLDEVVAEDASGGEKLDRVPAPGTRLEGDRGLGESHAAG
jgi:hypothetical protein